LCGSRIFIERAIYTKFRDAFVAKIIKTNSLIDQIHNCRNQCIKIKTKNANKLAKKDLKN
jgi:hypothetical protein